MRFETLSDEDVAAIEQARQDWSEETYVDPFETMDAHLAVADMAIADTAEIIAFLRTRTWS